MKCVPLSILAQTVKDALFAGRRVLKKGFSEKRRVSYKTPISPVTQVDREAERKIISLIRRRFPGHSFLAEESAFLKHLNMRRISSGYEWIIDPLDGTVNFLHHVPQFCVSVAVAFNGVVQAGGVMDPMRDELFLAVRGKGATLNGKRIRVSKERRFRRSLLVTGFPYDRYKKYDLYISLLRPFLRKTAGIRRYGSAALDLAWIACGRSEGYWEANLCPWDVAAGWLLVEEAGGKVTDFQGKPYALSDTTQTVASNGRIHHTMVRLFQKSRGQTPNQI